MKNTGYYTKSEKGKLDSQVIACLLAWYWQRNFPCKFTENCFFLLIKLYNVNLAHVLYCMGCCLPHVFLGIPHDYPLNGSVEDFG